VKDLNASSSSPVISDRSTFFLVGFMGSGKTHWGKRWALANRMSFVDLDEMIEKAEERTIRDIFEANGEDYFRKLEAQSLRLCADLHNTIIACGGGTPCFFDNMQWMNEHGITIYVAATTEQILRRVLAEQQKRPLLKKMSEGELTSFIADKLGEREPVYAQAQFTLHSDQLTEGTFAALRQL
jgi:shikimate kinase